MKDNKIAAIPAKAGIHFFLYLLLLTAFILSCGRRGDPVPIEPRIDKPAERAEEIIESEQPPVTQEVKTAPDTPEAPAGLVGVYTQTEVVLTWNEVFGENIRYRIYRSDGSDFIMAGETVTPAFTDRNIQPDKKYNYRVTAVGVNESLPSKEIIIITEMH